MRLNHLLAFLAVLPALLLAAETAPAEVPSLYTIEGEAVVPREMMPKKFWQRNIRILIDHGKYVGFVREDGKFSISNIPSGSYIIEAANADYVFEPVRVDITSKGKMRARHLNLLQPTAVSQLPYPLQLTARQPANYFRKREELKITDMLMNPMVLMLVVPMLLMVVLPKLTANDPELQKEMENLKMPKMDGLDMSNMLANYFGGGQPKKAIKKGGSGGGGNKKTR